MKVLVTYFDGESRSLNSNIITGGAEKFGRDLAKYLPEVVIEQIWPYDLQQAHDQNMEAVIKHKPDLLINNYIYDLVDLPQKLGIPMAWIWHGTYEFARDAGRVPMLIEHIKNGQKVFFVSKHQLETMKILFGDDAHFLDNAPIIPPGLIPTRPDVVSPKECEWYCSTIGRCEDAPNKDPFMLHRIFNDDIRKTLVQSNARPGKYFEENLYWTPPRHTMWNNQHDEVLKNMASSKVFMLTWPDETFGISALEAFARGVPVAIHSKNGTHASTELAVNGDQYRLFNSNKEAVAAVEVLANTSMERRKEIADNTWERYGLPVWQTKMREMFEKALG